MALIRNGGKYMVGIAVSNIQYNPGDRPDELFSDVGSGIQGIPENECRYVQAERINEEAYAIILAEENTYVIASARIGPHDFLEFNGEKFLDINLTTGECHKNHGW